MTSPVQLGAVSSTEKPPVAWRQNDEVSKLNRTLAQKKDRTIPFRGQIFFAGPTYPLKKITQPADFLRMTTVQVDSSRAWATVAGCFVSNFILGGLAKSYGIIMEAFQEEFDAPSVYFTLTGGILYMIMFVLSLPNHLIVERIGNRTVVMVGGVCSCLSLLTAAAAPSVTIWAVAVGGGLGFSFACVYFNIFAVVGRCFRKKLGLANGISVAGVSVGQMAFPSFVTFLLENYGVRAGTLVMAGFCLHICITAALMPRNVTEPPESTDPPTDLKVDCEDSEERQKDISIVEGELECLKPTGDDVLIANSRNSILSVTTLYYQSGLANLLLAVYIVGKGSASTAAVKASPSQSGYQFAVSAERSSLSPSSASADSPGFFSRPQPFAEARP
nr:unnamed protein product [Spirometra erinaceieuropaei]